MTVEQWWVVRRKHDGRLTITQGGPPSDALLHSSLFDVIEVVPSTVHRGAVDALREIEAAAGRIVAPVAKAEVDALRQVAANALTAAGGAVARV